jgi:oxygen-dependent protoporphyrinogen oxidase
MIWSDSVFAGRAPKGHRLFTCFYGGDIDPGAMDLFDGERSADLKHQVTQDLRSAMGFRGSSLPFLRSHAWQRAIPAFGVGHARRIVSINAALPEGLHLLGGYSGGISIPDRMQCAEEMAAAIIRNA